MLNKKTMTTVVGVLLLAFVLFFLRSCEDDPGDPSSRPGATESVETESGPRLQSTAYIVKKIKPRLDKISGLDVKLKCPKTIKLVAKEKMKCKVYRTPEGKGEPIAIVTVTMRDDTGYFTWKSVSTGA